MDQRYGCRAGALTCASTMTKPLRALMAIVGMVLMIAGAECGKSAACARGPISQRETAVRVALGSGWGRISAVAGREHIDSTSADRPGHARGDMDAIAPSSVF